MKRLAIFAFIVICVVAVLLLAGQEPAPVPRYVAWICDPSVTEIAGLDHPTAMLLWIKVEDATKLYTIRVVLEGGGEYTHPHHPFPSTGWHEVPMRLGPGDKVAEVKVTEFTASDPVDVLLVR